MNRAEILCAIAELHEIIDEGLERTFHDFYKNQELYNELYKFKDTIKCISHYTVIVDEEGLGAAEELVKYLLDGLQVVNWDGLLSTDESVAQKAERRLLENKLSTYGCLIETHLSEAEKRLKQRKQRRE